MSRVIAFCVLWLACAPAMASYAATVTGEATLLHYWKMDEAAGCSSLVATTGGVNLTVNGGGSGAIVCGVTGMTGGTAVTFDGIDDCAYTASAINLTGQSKVVVEMLVKVATGAYTSADKVGFEFGTGALAAEDFVWVPDNFGGAGGSQFVLIGGATTYTQYTIAALPETVDTWRHFVFVFDESGNPDVTRLYIDGVLITANATVSGNNPGPFGNKVFNLMCRNNASLYFPATVQHLAIYSDLSAARILAHYEATASVVSTRRPGCRGTFCGMERSGGTFTGRIGK